MTEIDIDAATRFMAQHARVLDRRRFDLLCGTGDAVSMLGALDGYRNPDGGTGGGSSPTFVRPRASPPARCTRSRCSPRPVRHDVAACGRAVRLARRTRRSTTAGCRSHDRSPIPPGARRSGRAPTPRRRRCTSPPPLLDGVPRRRPRPRRGGAPVAGGRDRLLPRRDRRITETPHAIALMYILHFLDAMVDSHPDVESTLRSVVADHLPSNGSMHVAGGLEDERLNPLDFSPYPDRPLRALIDAGRDRRRPRRWAAGQQRRRRLDRRLHQLLADRRPRVARIRHGARHLAARVNS